MTTWPEEPTGIIMHNKQADLHIPVDCVYVGHAGDIAAFEVIPLAEWDQADGGWTVTIGRLPAKTSLRISRPPSGFSLEVL